MKPKDFWPFTQRQRHERMDIGLGELERVPLFLYLYSHRWMGRNPPLFIFPYSHISWREILPFFSSLPSTHVHGWIDVRIGSIVGMVRGGSLGRIVNWGDFRLAWKHPSPGVPELREIFPKRPGSPYDLENPQPRHTFHLLGQ